VNRFDALQNVKPVHRRLTVRLLVSDVWRPADTGHAEALAVHRPANQSSAPASRILATNCASSSTRWAHGSGTQCWKWLPVSAVQIGSNEM
jgi:hypothetical protein